MSMVNQLKEARYLLAVLTVLLALPILAEETDKPAAPPPSTTPESQASTDATDQAKKPAKAPAPPIIQTPPESPTPPSHLRKVGDHWTPYEPPDPESFPEGAQIHVIIRGDTLWDMANTHFQNPYLWPQIWNENRYILDSHWIYPGDPLLLPPRPTVLTEIVPAGGQTAPPPEPAPEQEAPNGGPALETATVQTPSQEQEAPTGPSSLSGPSAVDRADIFCSGEIRADYKKTKLYIANEEQEGKIGLTFGDLVYINGGRGGNKVQAGDSFVITLKEGEVYHPLTDRWLGTYVRRLGRVKVLAAQEKTSIAEITEVCGDRIEVGSELELDHEIQVPEYRELALSHLDVEPSGKANGYVVHLQDSMTRAWTGKIVDVDLGSRDGLKPGDILMVYVNSVPPMERRVTYHYKWGTRRYEPPLLRDEDAHIAFPRKPIGQLVVLKASEKTSMTKVVDAIREIEIGSRVEVR